MADAVELTRLSSVLSEGARVTSTDVLVVGTGIAGLTAALHCSRDRSVTVVTKGRLTQTNTWYAQGGIAGAVSEKDSIESHVADTLQVGQGLCDEAVVRAVVGEAPEALESLLGFGVRFDLARDGGVALALEGGHSLPRVLHSGDRTGAVIQHALTETLVGRSRIPVLQNRFLADLVLDDEGGCAGALVLDATTGELEAIVAGAVVLATGGAGGIFPVTTNPPEATGDGVAAAWRAGAEVADLEFVQFHPTALDHEAAPRFLVSEALRGEGAYLLDCDGVRFMLGVHPQAELAPRDVVSREIERVMKRCGTPHAWLDARHIGEARLRSRFPNIWAACAEAGYDLSVDLLPVVPAAHYFVGGIRVDVDGRSSVPSLYVSGEAAASGLHGANRLASNSLLEGLVFSRRIARALDADGVPSAAAPAGQAKLSVPTRRASVSATRSVDSQAGETDGFSAGLSRLHDLAASGLGMARTAEGLEASAIGFAQIAASATGDGVGGRELANLACVAELVARAAALRTESRGCHSRLDHPDRDDARWRAHLVFKRHERPRFEPVRES
ncbi:MAG: L-aspartate oxidase [Coriobacteriia bacterium]|nr:L-aspartate oxidase [Coriobacteriia bacterium]